MLIEEVVVAVVVGWCATTWLGKLEGRRAFRKIGVVRSKIIGEGVPPDARPHFLSIASCGFVCVWLSAYLHVNPTHAY